MSLREQVVWLFFESSQADRCSEMIFATIRKSDSKDIFFTDSFTVHYPIKNMTTTQADEAIETLRRVAQTESGLWYALRADLRWDESAFQRIVKTLPPALEALQDRTLVPHWFLVPFAELKGSISLMSHPLFEAPQMAGASAAEKQSWMNARREFLSAAEHALCQGTIIPEDRVNRVT